jgi:type VI secretion system secreted protein VgrG
MAANVLELEIDGTALQALRVRGHFALGEAFSLEVDAHELETTAPAPEERLAAKCVVRVKPPAGEALVVHGIVFEVSTEAPERDELPVHRFEIRPAAYALSIGRDHRYFQDKNAIEIAKEIIRKASIENVEWTTTGTPRPRAYVVQYGESDWDFLQRILAEEGISHRFDFEEDKTTWVFVDDSSQAPEIDGGPVAYHAGSALIATEDAVHEVQRKTQLGVDHVVLRDYDPKKPRLDLEVKAEADTKARGHYDYPGRYETVDAGKALAKKRLEALRARAIVTSGHATALRIRPGLAFAIEGHPVDSFAAKLFAIALDLDFEEQGGGTTRTEVRWQAIPLTVPFRPEVVEYAPQLVGPQTAAMAGPSGKELHVDDSGRIRAQFRWDRQGKGDDKSSTWMRVGQFPLGGSMVLPRIGWDLLVEQQGGDGDVPFVLSHLYDGTHPPPYALPGNMTRSAWQSATVSGSGANEIRFEDKQGSEEIFLNASKDMTVTIGDTKQKKVGNNHTLEVGANREVKVGSNRKLGVKADQKVTVGAAESLTVSGARSTGIKGNESITIGAARTVTAVGGKSLDADGGRTLTVGGTMSAISAMGVSRAVLGSASVTVGGSWISAAGMGLDHATAGVGSETIGGAKLQVGAGGVSLTTKGALAETVGAAYVTTAGGSFGETAAGMVSI